MTLRPLAHLGGWVIWLMWAVGSFGRLGGLLISAVPRLGSPAPAGTELHTLHARQPTRDPRATHARLTRDPHATRVRPTRDRVATARAACDAASRATRDQGTKSCFPILKSDFPAVTH